MIRNIKYGKIAAAIFITVLIWVWADLRKTENFPVFDAAISIAKSTNPNLWVSFNDESSVPIEKIVLKGPASRIDKVRRKIRDGSLSLEFVYDPEPQAIIKPEYLLDVFNLLRGSDRIKQLGLTVESCEPDMLAVKVVELGEKSLVVKCIDEDRIPIKGATIEPDKVDIFVPEDWVGDAEVQLTDSEIEQARVAAIKKTPYVKLAVGRIGKAATTVNITTPPEEDPRKNYPITTATLGFSLSENLQSKYKVQVANLNEVRGPITIRATPEAKQAYEGMRYQVILEIDDEDIKAEEVRREVVYNFPGEYVRKDEIMLNQQPVTARFKLIPLPSAEAP